MATFGSGINAALGAINYSPYTQGALVGAQGIGQGIAALGQGVGEGIKQYQQNKLLAATQIGKFEALVQNDPSIIQKAPPEALKLIQKLQTSGSLGLKDAAQLGAYVDVYSQQETQRIAKQAAMLQNIYSQTGGQTPGMINLQNFDPRAVAQGRESYNRQENIIADTAQKRAAAQPTPAKGTVMTSQQFEALNASGKRVDGVPLPTGEILVTGIGASAPNDTAYEGTLADEIKAFQAEKGRPPTDTERAAIRREIDARKLPKVLTPDEELEKFELQNFVKRVDEFRNIRLPGAQATLDNIKQIRSLQDAGGEQGAGANLRLEIAKGINAIAGTTIIDTSKEEALKTTYADMALNAAQKMKGQGQITEKERLLLADSIAKFGDSPQAVEYILSFMEAVSARELALAEMDNMSVEGGAKYKDRRKAWDTYMSKNPLSFNNGMVTFGPGVTAPDAVLSQADAILGIR